MTVTTRGEYVPVAKKAVKTTVLGFGATATTNTSVNLATAKGHIPEVNAVHDRSSNPIYSGGTENYFGSPIMVGATESLNGVANLALQTTGNASKPEYHTSKLGRGLIITAMNALTGAITYGSGTGDSYSMTTAGADNVVDSVVSPYSVPAHLTHLGGKAPIVSSYKVAH